MLASAAFDEKAVPTSARESEDLPVTAACVFSAWDGGHVRLRFETPDSAAAHTAIAIAHTRQRTSALVVPLEKAVCRHVCSEESV